MGGNSGHADREIEVKFDVPHSLDRSALMLRSADLALRSGWQLASCRFEQLFFEYFDTARLHAYKRGDTIRRVSGFTPSARREAKYRYDFKVGPISERFESNHWDDKRYSADEIPALFRLRSPYDQLGLVACADTMHLKMYFRQDRTEVEITQDIFSVRAGGSFRELEIELGQGDKDVWRSLCEKVEKEFCLTPIDRQKYGRVVDSLQRCLEESGHDSDL